MSNLILHEWTTSWFHGEFDVLLLRHIMKRRITQIYQQVEKKWLGEISEIFSDISFCSNLRIENAGHHWTLKYSRCDAVRSNRGLQITKKWKQKINLMLILACGSVGSFPWSTRSQSAILASRTMNIHERETGSLSALWLKIIIVTSSAYFAGYSRISVPKIV